MSDAPNALRTVLQALAGEIQCLTACDALDDELEIFVNDDGHC
jgi:hypothetical protein